MYNALAKNDEGPAHKLIWKGKIPQIKIFMWLLANNVVLTKDNLIKRKWSGSSKCSFCDFDKSVSSLFHLSNCKSNLDCYCKLFW